MDNYYFRCKIGGFCDPPVVTESGLLTTKTAPEFIQHPEAVETCQGEDVTFTVEATGTEPLQYKWRKGNAALTGWISQDSYSLYSVSPADIEKYDVVVKNECNEIIKNTRNNKKNIPFFF